MSSTSGPNNNTNGLVFAYDTANTQKSWKGAQTTNLLSNPTREVIGTSSEFVQYADLAPIFNTNGLVPYSLSLELKAKKPGSVLVYMQNGSWTKYSFVYHSVNVTTKYKRFTFNNLTPAISTATETAAILAFYGTYGSGVIPSIRNVQVELGSFATPFVNGTRTNNQSLIDLKGNNTITASSLTHASDGSFSFAGAGGVGASGNYISCGNSSQINFDTGNFTLSFVSYRTSSGIQGGSYVSKGDGTSLGFDFRDETFYIHGASGLIASIPFNQTLNVWQKHDFVFDRSSSPYIKYYLNGIYSSSSTTNNSAYISSSINTSRALDIGRSQAGGVNRYFNGNIPMVKLYNRALSAAEVRQNFNAIRGRFGI